MATITRVNFETILVARAGGLMGQAGLAITVGGTNADLINPMRYGIVQADGTVVDWTVITDADIATVASADHDQMIDIAELRLLQDILQNLVLVDTEVGERDVKYDQLASRLKVMIKAKQDSVDSLYGFGAAVVSTAVWDLNFAEHDEDNVDELGR